MVPALEQMGIRVLLNEAETLERGGRRIHLVGIDDAHYYRLDSIEKAVSRLPDDEFSILLSHTPRSIAKRRMPILICCLADIPTAARSACQARSQSR